MSKILITGGAGFIGFHLANKLSDSDNEVHILDNFSRAVKDSELNNLANNVRIIDENLLDENIFKKLDRNYDYIYHLAALLGVKNVLKSPYQVLDKNISLLKNTIIVSQNQKNLERLIFSSTSEVYAGTLQYYGLAFPTKENTPLTITNLNEARSTYMLSKIYGESLCVNSMLPITIIRPHNFYGPRMGLSHVIPELMKKAIESKNSKIDVFSINHQRTFCYIDDAVDSIHKLAESKKSIGKAYNIGDDTEETTMADLSKRIIKIVGKELTINPQPTTPGSPERRCPSISKLKNDINYVKMVSLDSGLEKTFRWYNKFIFSGKEKSAI
jgi:UDP-glucose 4-epimerase